MVGSKRKGPFRAKYAVELAMRVKDRDPVTQEVYTATCLFCEVFRRENKPAAKRRATEKVAVFKAPFRKDSIQIHHVGQHPVRWTEYCALASDDSKRAYFIAAGANIDLPTESSSINTGKPLKTALTDSNVPNSTLNLNATSTLGIANFNSTCNSVNWTNSTIIAGPALHWLVNRDIVAVIIGAMLPYAAAPLPDGQTYQLHAVADFQDMLDAVEVQSGAILDAAVARYRVVIQDSTQFHQFVEYLSTNGSLTNTARMLHSQVPLFDGGQALPVDVAKYARYLCAINFQRIAEVANSVGVFSIGLKVAPIATGSFFEAQVEYCLHVQLRAFVNGDVTSFHIVSIPLNQRRRSDPSASSGVFEIAQLALNAVIAQWQDKMLAVVSDSDAIVARESQDPRFLLRNAVVSRFENVAKPGFLRVCCAARQLDLLMQKVFDKLLGSDEVYSQLTGLVSFISRQHFLLTSLKTSAPHIGDNRWKSTAKIAMWFRRYGVSVREHLQRELSSCTPPNSWWMRVLLAARIGQEVTPILDEISGLTTETSAPREALVRVRSFLTTWFNVSGPLELDDPAVAAAATRPRDDNTVISRDGKYSVNTNDVFRALEDLGTFVAETLTLAGNENEASHSVVRTTMKEIAMGVINLVSGLTSITYDIDSFGVTLSDLPPVLPHELVKLRGRQFSAILRPQTDRLRVAGWTQQEIDWIEQDFQNLCGAYFRESSLKLTLDSSTSTILFRDAWNCVGGKFTHLQRFCGLLATAYPTAGNGCPLDPTTRVATLPGDIESGVCDLSVQAALHAKQFRRLQALQL